MKEQGKSEITVISGKKNEPSKRIFSQTNPIVKKLLEFHNISAKKFSVKDIFKK